MRRILKVWAVVVIAIIVFFFVPLIPLTTANFRGGPDYQAMVSPSFAFFQCGDFVGHAGIEVPNGATVNPYKPHASFWNCDYPHL